MVNKLTLSKTNYKWLCKKEEIQIKTNFWAKTLTKLMNQLKRKIKLNKLHHITIIISKTSYKTMRSKR